MRVLKILFLLFIIIELFGCQTKEEIPTVGQKISDYKFDDIINGEELSLYQLNGKPIILEFWATWCGPCIPAIKKLDSLQKKYQNNLEVITVSSDNRDRLEKFLKKNNLDVRVAFDKVHTEHFPYEVIPHSILIDKNGVVKAITSPKFITEQIISNLINNKPLDLKEKNDFQTDESSVKVINEIRDTEKNIVLTKYNPTKRTTSRINWSPDGIATGLEYNNLPLPNILQQLYKIKSFKRVEFLDDLSAKDFNFEPENEFNLLLELSNNYEDNLYKIGQDFMNESFAINARKKIKNKDVYILSNQNNKLQASKRENPESFARGSMYVGNKRPISELVTYLENVLDLPVVDKTNLSADYDITLQWEYDDKSTLFDALETYGLEVEKSRTKLPIEILEIYKKSE